MTKRYRAPDPPQPARSSKSLFATALESCASCREAWNEFDPVSCSWCGITTVAPHLMFITEPRSNGICHDCSKYHYDRARRRVNTLLTDPIPPETWKRLGMWGVVKELGLQRRKGDW